MTRFALWVVMLSAAVVWADIPPSDVSGCNDKKVGDSCKRDDGSSGTCAKETCSRNDYSNGPPPKSVQYECVRCSASGSAPAGKSCSAVPHELLFGAVGALWVLRRSMRSAQS